MSDVCDVNKVGERVNEWCVWESVGPMDVRERKEKNKKVILWGVVWGHEIGEILEWCEKRKRGCGKRKKKTKSG